MKTKTCSRCKETKSVSEFSKDRGRKDGLQSQCKGCWSSYGRKYRELNKEKLSNKQRRWRSENKEKVSARNRSYYEANRAQVCRQTTRRGKERNNRSLELAHRQGLPWEDWEDRFVLADNGLTEYQRAVKLGRSCSSIQTRKRNLRKNLVTS